MITFCKKCEEEPGADIVLIGGVVVNLCPACRTAWHELVVEHSAFKRLEYLTAAAQSIIMHRELSYQGDEIYEVLLTQIRDCKRTLFEMGQAWLDEQPMFGNERDE